MDYYKKYKIYKKKYLKLKSKKQGINVVSWNIGDNINQKKIQELLNQIKKENSIQKSGLALFH